MTPIERGTDAVRIAVLPELVRNQIAAGEVVERPASVVKELVENALDAGATHIEVALEEGGARAVRVHDDGGGMGPTDVALAFEPHATSKLRDVSDLDHVATLGFRGEALASIGSVARCRVVSRPAGAELGVEVVCEGGRRSEPREVGVPEGTRVEVRDLFFNTPARRRFLKRTATELARCLDVLQRLALAHEGVGLVVLHDGRRVLDVEPSMDLRQRIRRLFGAELSEALVAVEGTDGDTILRGYVAPPRFARGDTSRQMWFLNGRPLRDRLLLRCLREAYRGSLDSNRQPVAFLSLSLDPGRVDVNVHPTKTEVRFREDRRLFGFLLNTLRAGVQSTDMATPGADLLERALRRGPAAPHAGQAALPDPGVLQARVCDDGLVVREVPGRDVESTWPAAVPRRADRPGEHPAPRVDEAWAASDDLRGPFLQVARTYLVRALPGGFEVVDQHALHERLTYEGLRREAAAGTPEVQRLLVPELVEVGRAQRALLADHAGGLERIGLLLEPFGETTVAVHGLPARLRHPDAEGLVRDVIEILERTGRAPDEEDVIEEVLHSAACRSSVMAGDELEESEIRELLGRAAELGGDQTCPHGRPTRVRFTLEDLERAFHRR